MASDRQLRLARGAHQRINVMIQCHPAFLTMTPSAQILLLDIYAAHARWTRYYTVDLPEPGFPYSFAHCSLLMHRNTFYASLRTILHRGFIRETDRDSERAETRYYKPHNGWRSYKPPESEQVKLVTLRDRMERADRRDLERLQRVGGGQQAQFLGSPQHIIWANSKAHKHFFCAENGSTSTKIVPRSLIGEKDGSRTRTRALDEPIPSEAEPENIEDDATVTGLPPTEAETTKPGDPLRAGSVIGRALDMLRPKKAAP